MTSSTAKGGRRDGWPRPHVVLPLLLGLFLPLALAGCNTLQLGQPLRVAPGDWTTAGGSNARANATDGVFALPLERAWRYDAEAAFGPAAAVTADGTVLVVTKRGELHAVEVETGRRRGVGNLKDPVAGAPVLTERVLYAALADGKHTLIAYDLVDGGHRWSLRAGPHEAGLLLEAGTLVAAGLDGTVRGIEPAQGAVRWTAAPDSAAGFFAAPVALPAGRAAVADDRGRVTALDLATGAADWTHALGLPVYESPAAHADLLLVPTARGRFVALDAANGSERWAFNADDPTVRFAAPAVAGDLVLVGSSDGRLRALDASTGALRWSFSTDGAIASAPLVAGDLVFVGAMDETLYALDLASGEVRWQAELDGRVKSEPLVHGGYLIVLAEPSFVYAFTATGPVAETSRTP